MTERRGQESENEGTNEEQRIREREREKWRESSNCWELDCIPETVLLKETEEPSQTTVEVE